MVQDARQRTKTHLETYLSDANLTKDDDVSRLNYIVAFAIPDYGLVRVFKDKQVDLTVSIIASNSSPLMGHDGKPYGYKEHVTIETACINKSGITGTKVKQKAKAELRRILELYPFGSERSIEREEDADRVFGSTTIYGDRVVWTYRRDTLT